MIQTILIMHRSLQSDHQLLITVCVGIIIIHFQNSNLFVVYFNVLFTTIMY